ncbi:hypothetical protein LTR02_014915 [Friedmanniomyces endolithicus]|nr:hypothetical protein LTR02_014915 [Friedmanniomyces endolithicus]
MSRLAEFHSKGHEPHLLQKANDNSTGSPGFATVTPAPTSLTYPLPSKYNQNMRQKAMGVWISLTLVPEYSRIERNGSSASGDPSDQDVSMAYTTGHHLHEQLAIAGFPDADVFHFPAAIGVGIVTYDRSCGLHCRGGGRNRCSAELILILPEFKERREDSQLIALGQPWVSTASTPRTVASK